MLILQIILRQVGTDMRVSLVFLIIIRYAST